MKDKLGFLKCHLPEAQKTSVVVHGQIIGKQVQEIRDDPFSLIETQTEQMKTNTNLPTCELPTIM